MKISPDPSLPKRGIINPLEGNLVGSGLIRATPSQQNGSYRPGKPLFD
jgi:hypothetical protein